MGREGMVWHGREGMEGGGEKSGAWPRQDSKRVHLRCVERKGRGAWMSVPAAPSRRRSQAGRSGGASAHLRRIRGKQEASRGDQRGLGEVFGRHGTILDE